MEHPSCSSHTHTQEEEEENLGPVITIVVICLNGERRERGGDKSIDHELMD